MSEPCRPNPPEHLDGEALLEWHRVCDELATANRLDTTDRALLTLYVETWAIYQDVMRHVRQHGAVVKWPNGVVGGSPFYKTSRETAAQLRTMLTDLGLTPLTRSKVKPDEKKPVDESGY